MKIKALITCVADLVASRETIDHGSIRCLWSQSAVDSIESAEDCDEVATGIIGDDDLASELSSLAAYGVGEVDLDVLIRLERVFLGEEVDSYVDGGKEDELRSLADLIDAARELVRSF